MPPSEQIRSIRERLGLSQAAFSAAYELPLSVLADWESGELAPPVYVLKMLDLIVKAYPPEKEEAPE